VQFDDPSYEELKELVAAQQLLIEQQAACIAELEAKLVELERRVGRNPRNSSMPPSAEGLSKPPANRVERRQVFEVPRTRAHVAEHQLVKLRCSCGCETKAPAPNEATAPACYVPGVRALAVYLSGYQHVPYDRLAEIFTDVLATPVSVGRQETTTPRCQEYVRAST